MTGDRNYVYRTRCYSFCWCYKLPFEHISRLDVDVIVVDRETKLCDGLVIPSPNKSQKLRRFDFHVWLPQRVVVLGYLFDGRGIVQPHDGDVVCQ